MLATSRRCHHGPQAWSIPAAHHGLEFTQPFHDKRVVEFGLAIPGEFHVKAGRPRAIPLAALHDLYPPEFQQRMPSREYIGGDFGGMADRIRPYVLGEIDRMEKEGRLSRYFDFKRMRRMVAARSERESFNSKMGFRAFMYARFVEWFEGRNG
jgi:asparagine synthase (glutamine-hydrolysing)